MWFGLGIGIWLGVQGAWSTYTRRYILYLSFCCFYFLHFFFGYHWRFSRLSDFLCRSWSDWFESSLTFEFLGGELRVLICIAGIMRDDIGTIYYYIIFKLIAERSKQTKRSIRSQNYKLTSCNRTSLNI